MLGGITGIFMIGVGIVWTVIAAQASGLFALFGVFWTCIAVVMTIYNFKNATGENRYSAYDITDHHEEPDPLNERFGGQSAQTKDDAFVESLYCPYCGTKVEGEYIYCNRCGKKLP